MESIQTDADKRVSEAIKQSEENVTASESKNISALQKDFAMKMSEMQQSHQQVLNELKVGQSTVSEQIKEMQATH